MKSIIIILITIVYISLYGQEDTIKWHKLSQLPQSIGSDEFGQFQIDSDFYVAGGWLGSVGGMLSNTVWRYHIPNDTWYQMSNLPFGGAASSGSFVLNGKGYFLAVGDSINTQQCDTIFWEFDPIADNWTKKASFPDAPRQNSSFFTYDGKGYIGQTAGCATWDSHFWEYDPILDKWFQIASLLLIFQLEAKLLLLFQTVPTY